MKSLYGREFSIMAGVILLSFALLAGAFVTLTYQYTIREKQDAMERTADTIADFTSAMQNANVSLLDSSYQAYLAAISNISDAYVMICDEEGQVLLSSKGALRDGAPPSVPTSVAREVSQNGGYNDITSLGGLFPEKRYTAGQMVTVSNLMGREIACGMVFVSASMSSVTALWQDLSAIFFMTAAAVLCVAFLTSSVTSRHQTKPLKEIADTARRFGHGEFDVRVTGYEHRKDEVGELAEAFNAMADSIAQSEAKRSEFIANVSHELKTPMTTIAGFADGILDGTIPPERERDYLKTISSETRRLSRLVRRMLDLSRLQSSENVTAQEPFDTAEVMLRVLVSLETKINARHLDVDAHLPDGPVMVWGDPDAITQVCYNLLDNAIKFSDEGTTMGIGITTKGGKAYVSVRNQGKTIPPEELSLLFDRFHKADHSRSADRDGVGLGLYIVKTILGNHKENITVTSSEGVTEFTFTLTLA
ncbi:HAMP domain-containing histidine kinase [Pseudoflavonifractor phocaeensis]|uniref:sensor histidine kinase n=1 Tax=Pseudoflavonifractor phocaeensis TaxID=1870988 RepID=UPI00195AE75B|nr:HAMP domain-containing sensor histidine kinase [Pseudoflavonifractor phocaeensis]MBM6938294.1 HAMP domain-containing histidine kinase [Pseudoflavonifractor phocaeensis]